MKISSTPLSIDEFILYKTSNQIKKHLKCKKMTIEHKSILIQEINKYIMKGVDQYRSGIDYNDHKEFLSKHFPYIKFKCV